MTRDEAVARIKDHIEMHRYRERNAVKIFEALDMTIKAVDAVSRQAAIDAIEETDWYHQNKNKDMVHGANSQEHQAWYKAEDIYQALNRLPSVQPELYGYKIEHLALIARVMQKEGVSPEKAVKIFADICSIVQMFVDEQKEMESIQFT